MAYYLAFDGVNDYVDMPLVNYVSGDVIEVVVTGFTGVAGSNRYLLDAEANNNAVRPFLFVRSDGQIQFNTSNFSFVTIDGTPATSQSTIFPTDGLDHTIIATLSSTVELGRLGSRLNNVNTWNAGIKSLKITRGASTLNDYDPSASNGTGQILPDTVGGSDGTLVNFPTDNSQWIFYDDGGAVTADVTEVSTDAIESSSISISANITAQVTELSIDATESSAAAFTTTISVSVTELSDSATESSTTTITNNLVTADVTELSTDFSESAAASFSGSLSAIVTELAQNATESSIADISANISLAVTELAQDFADNANVNLVGSFTVEVTETTTDFDEACYVQLPVQRLTPRKTISVNARRSGRISVNARNSQTIKVR